MYNNRPRRSSSQKTRNSQSRPHRFDRSGGNRRSGGNKRKAFTGAYIDPRKFINKATPTEAAVASTKKTLFSDLSINNDIKRSIAKRGFEHTTEIQAKTIPHILEGKDLIGLANTGTGKTGAFLIPMIHKMMNDQRQKLLVIAPTRELAIQIEEEFTAFTKSIHMRAVVVVGGANIRPQIQQLRSRHNIVIGTPGRIKDLVTRKVIKLESFSNVVLDEADRMLDMGFINDIRFFLAHLASPRHTLLFSATMPREIEKLISEFLTSPIRISVKTRETSAQVDQDIVQIKKGEDKLDVLDKLLKQSDFQKVLIFGRTKYGCEKLSKKLSQRGHKATAIHGNKSHNQRQRALQQFKNGQMNILVATDVAARGLDIPNVSHVINYDVPATYEDYTHRIGRTGRADKTGKALTFIE